MKAEIYSIIMALLTWFKPVDKKIEKRKTRVRSRKLRHDDFMQKSQELKEMLKEVA